MAAIWLTLLMPVCIAIAPKDVHISTMAQMKASVAAGTAIDRGRKYHEVLSAEDLMAKMCKNVKRDQIADHEQASGVVARIEHDIARLKRAYGAQSEAAKQAEDVATRVSREFAAVQRQKEKLDNDLVSGRAEQLQTTNDCQDLQTKLLRAKAASASDLSEVTTTIKTLGTVDCMDLKTFVDSLSLPPSKGTPLTSNHFLSFLDISALPPADVDFTDHTPFTNELECDKRRLEIFELLQKLKEHTKEAARENAKALEKSLDACRDDLSVQNRLVAKASAELAVLSRDSLVRKEETDITTAAYEDAKAVANKAKGLLDDKQSARSTQRCQFLQRSRLREQQSSTCEQVLSLLRDLTNSTYSEQHFNVGLNCPNLCNGHGVCLHGGCVCETGWFGDTCNISQPHSCPFAESLQSPCRNTACAARDFEKMSKFSTCANVSCGYCNTNAGAHDPGCTNKHMLLFCAERQRLNGCGNTSCHEMETCAAKRTVIRPFKGCCFNAVLDCGDACANTSCPQVNPNCGRGLAVRHPFRSCCFDAALDCVDECAVASCSNEPPSCPAGHRVRSPFYGCCFDATKDCEDECMTVVCDIDKYGLPVDACQSRGMRWRGTTVGCCFDVETDCATGDDDGQEGDRQGLMAIYAALNGKHWPRQRHWGSTKWVCYWEGVDCQGSVGAMRVTSIVLKANALTGQLPDQLGLITDLVVFDISNNDVSGPLPAALGTMSKLASLKVRQNQMTGVVPEEVQRLPSLGLLDLAYNFFTGSLDSDLVERPSLTLTCTSNCMCEQCAPMSVAAGADGEARCPACP